MHAHLQKNTKSIILYTFLKKIYDIRFTLVVLGSNPLLIMVVSLGLSGKKKTLIIMIIRIKVLRRR